jgi:co-chaperonin GroES (HSP10)
LVYFKEFDAQIVKEEPDEFLIIPAQDIIAKEVK